MTLKGGTDTLWGRAAGNGELWRSRAEAYPCNGSTFVLSERSKTVDSCAWSQPTITSFRSSLEAIKLV